MALTLVGITSGTGTSSSSAAVSYHGSTAAGDLVLVLLHNHDSSVGFTLPSGYTSLFTDNLSDSGGGSSWRAYYQFSTGTPGSPAATLSASVNEYAWVCYTLRDARFIFASSSASATSDDFPDPSAVSPSQSGEIFQIAACAVSGAAASVGWPSGHADGHNFVGHSDRFIGVAHKEDNTSSDPGPFEVTGAYEWFARSIVAKNGATGTCSVTEDADSCTGTGSSGVAITGTCAVTEGDDTPSGTGVYTIPGAGSPTEDPDTAASSGAITTTGSSAITEQADNPSGTGGSFPNPTGTVASTESDDSPVATGIIAVPGTSASTEDTDSSTASGSIALTGTLAVTEDADTPSATGATFPNPTGTTAATENGDTSLAAGVMAIAGSLASVEQDDAAAASGATIISGSSASTNAADQGSASGILEVVGSAAALEDAEASSGVGTSTQEGTLVLTEGIDTPSGAGSIGVTGSAAITGGASTASGSGIFAITGSLAVTESNDPARRNVQVARRGGPRHCCCGECLLLEDNFDRAELGPDWDGSGSIVGGVLYANEDTITVCHPPAFPLGSVYATMYMIDTDPSRAYEVRVGDPAGSYTVTVEFAGTMGLGTGTMTVTVSDGADSESFEYPWLYADEYLRVCYEPGVQLSASIESRGEYSPWVTMCIPFDPHGYCWGGLGNWTFVSGRWDTFYYSAHWIDRQDCPSCDCKCWYINEDGSYEISCIPKVLHLTISSDDCPDFLSGTYTMNQLHPYTIPLSAYPTVGPWPTKEAWITDPIECPAGGFEFAFILLCGQYSGTEKPKFRLQMVRWNPGEVFYTRFAFDPLNPNSSDPASDSNYEAFAFTELESTCDPLYLEWPTLIEDAFQSSATDQSCCGGYIASGIPPDDIGFESPPSTFTIIITW